MALRTRAITLAVLGGSVASVASAQVFHGVSGSSTTMHGGDRQLNSLSFSGASNSMTGADFARFADGNMTTYVSGDVAGPFGWNDAIPRDMSTAGNLISGNPDRSPDSTKFLGEAQKTGTLSEVFGTSRMGYKNMSWIIDGEVACGVEKYTINLFFNPGFTLSADNNPNTVELSFLERGANSDIKIYGLKPDRSTTSALFIPREKLSNAGWDLKTLEIADPQVVGGVGVSLGADWQNVVGLRVEENAGYNGPDIVGIGVTNVPAPGALVLSGIGGLLLLRRRR